MKKLLLSVVAVMALGTAAQAQAPKFGIKGGVNFANFGGDVEDASSRTGFHAGVVAEFKLTETFSIQPEVLFSQQGSQNEITDAYLEDGITVTDQFERKQTLNYINIPVAFKYYITDGLTIHAGPQIGFLVSAEAKNEGSTVVEGILGQAYSTSVDNQDDFKSIDFSVVGGVGYELPMGLFFEARYQAGISSVLEDSEELDAEDISMTNNVFSLSVGFKF